MADTIDRFLEKLQKEGVEVGQAEASKIVERAKAHVEQVLTDARKQAEEIVSQARDQAEQTLKRGREELALAARDATLKLQQAISETLTNLLKEASAGPLNDPEFLSGVLREIILAYARQEAEEVRPIEVRVSDETLHRLVNWALKEMSRDGHPRVDLKGRLRTAGFEYSVSGGVVEVTPESVSAVLSDMLSPRLRDLVSGPDKQPDR